MLPNVYELQKLSEVRYAEWEQSILDEAVLSDSREEANRKARISGGSSLFTKLRGFVKNLMQKEKECDIPPPPDRIAKPL